MKRIISLLMIALMLVTSVPYGGLTAGAADADTENYTLTFEASLADSFTAESSAEGAVSFFGSAEFDGCYGNQLSDVARELYDSLVKSYAADKITGEYTYAFDTPFTFNAEVSDGSIISNDELEEIKLELHYAMQAAMDAFLYDHPEVFWLKLLGSSYSISASGNEVIGYTGIIDEITIIPTEIYDGAASKLSQYASAVEAALDNITVTESRYDTLKNVHDYICEKAWYNLVSEQRVHSSEPFFIGDGGVVCEGYAKAFKVLCDRLEIPCVLVSGDAGGAHMWNYVQMDDGKWYLVDATWDDQNSQIFDTYFLANADTIGFNGVAISAERTERTDFSGTGMFSFTYPVLSATAYTVHVHEWESEYTVDLEPTCTEKGSKSIHCRTCDETKSVTEVPATNHADKTEYAQMDATCTENGYTSGVYCSDCEAWIEGHDVVIAKGHTDENTDGFCDECEEYLSEIVETGKCGENAVYTLYADGMLIISGEGATTEYYSSPFRKLSASRIVIKKGITNISSALFKDCSNIESIVIPDTVKSIGYASFSNCTSLTNITIPDSVVTIGTTAFSGCDSFTYVEIPDSVTSIGDSAFSICKSLRRVVIGDGVETIGDAAFNQCEEL